MIHHTACFRLHPRYYEGVKCERRLTHMIKATDEIVIPFPTLLSQRTYARRPYPSGIRVVHEFSRSVC